ncbi:MAG: hypothetical protein IKS31_11080 [Clostridia bacterium]|nr:hypothetical protein [Clostridia bacterium]
MTGERITRASLDALAEELEDRCGRVRGEIARRLEAARAAGDLLDNPAYKAAGAERDRNEERIAALRRILLNADGGEAVKDNTTRPE